jgi:nitrogen regulatory protein P-II 1
MPATEDPTPEPLWGNLRRPACDKRYLCATKNDSIMPYKKVHAVIRTDALPRVKERLQELHLPNLVVTKVKEYGDHHEIFAFRTEYRYARIEVFADEAQARQVATVIVETAHTGMPGDGLVAILPVEAIYHVRDKSQAVPDQGSNTPGNGHQTPSADDK